MSPQELERIEKGDIVLREIPIVSGEGRHFEALATIPASPSRIYRVLTDFEKYSEFMPNISSVEVLERSPGDAVVNYILELPLGKVKKYRLKLHFSEDGAEAGISWRMLPWPGLPHGETIRDTSGYWMLKPFPGAGSRSIVIYNVYTDPGPVPFGMEWIVDFLSKKSLPRTIESTRERIARDGLSP